MDFFDAHGLAGEDRAEIDFFLAQTDAAATRDYDGFIVEWIVEVLWFALRKPLGRPGIWVFGILGFVAGLTITRAVLIGRFGCSFRFRCADKENATGLAETMFGGLALFLDTKGKESIYISAVAGACTFVRGRGS